MSDRVRGRVRGRVSDRFWGGESLSPAERRALGTLADRVDLGRVRVHRGGTRSCRRHAAPRVLRRLVLLASGGRAIALGNHVFLPRHCTHDLPTLAHEVTHCGQYQAWGPVRYFTRGLLTQTGDLLHRLTGRGRSAYRYEPDPNRPFEAYGMEQQGQIVEDSFRGDPRALAVSPFRPAHRWSEGQVVRWSEGQGVSEPSNRLTT